MGDAIRGRLLPRGAREEPSSRSFAGGLLAGLGLRRGRVPEGRLDTFGHVRTAMRRRLGVVAASHWLVVFGLGAVGFSTTSR